MAEQLLLMSGRANTADPAPADGAVASLSLDSGGRLRTANKTSSYPVVSQALIAVNDALTVDVSTASSLVFHVKNTGSATMSAGTFVFEGSLDSTNGTDGTWFGLQAARSNANTIEITATALAIAAGAGTIYAWELSVTSMKYFRIRCTVATTASSIATFTAIRSSDPVEPIAAVGAHAVTMTSTTVSPVIATALPYAVVTAAATNAAVVKATAGNLLEISVSNLTAAIIYVKLYNKATAPTVGTDVPLITIPVPVGGFISYEMGFMGKRFNLGIGIATTAAAAATDVAVVAAGAQISATYI